MILPVSQQYPELFHYTTFEGLKGILSSGCIWASEATYLNDSSEITHFFDVRLRALVREEARRCAIELARNPQGLAELLKDGGIDQVVDRETDAWCATLRRVTLAMNQPFVVSLCGPSDTRVQHSGLLSQWRGYGGNGGYAVVFDTFKLEELLTVEVQRYHYTHVQIGDVYYHGIEPGIQAAAAEVAEYEEIVHEGVSRLMRGGTADETERFYEAMTALSCLGKHWGFWEEREVRILVVPASDEVAAAGGDHVPPRKKIKSRGESKIPYVELFSHLQTASPQGKLPIKRVIVGPHKDRELHAAWVREHLAGSGYTSEVVLSEIPYIG